MSETVINTTIVKDVISNSKFSMLHFTVFILCLFAIMGEGYNIFLYGAVLPLLVEEWSLSPAQAGIIGSYSLVGMMLGSMLFGWLADKVGRKNVIMVCIAFYSVFTALGGFASSSELFSWYRFFAGLGIGGVVPNVIALTADYSPRNLQNTMVSIMLCGMQVGGILGPAISMATMNNYGWHAVLWVGSVPLLLIPVMLKYMPDSVDFLIHKRQTEQIRKILKSIKPDFDLKKIVLEDEGKTKVKPGIKSLFQGGRAKNNVIFCVAYFMSLLMIYGLGTWLPELMIRTGYDVSASLVFPIILNVGCILGTFIFAVIADKFLAPKKLLVILFLIAAGSLVLLGFKYSTIILYILVFITGACTYGNQNLANAFVSQSYPSSVRSTGLGLCNAVGRMGAIFGTAFWGLLLQWNLPSYAVFVIFAIPALITAASYFMADNVNSL